MKKNKRKIYKKNILYTSVFVMTFFIVFAVSIGYSAFGTDLSVNILSTVDPVIDIRVNNFQEVASSDENSYSVASNFTKKSVYANFILDSDTSWVKYKVTIRNLGNKDMGILEYIDSELPSNIEYVVEGYELNDVLCDDIVPAKCTLNSTTTFYITFQYKDTATVTEPSTFNINIDFLFEGFESVEYSSGICSGCPTSIMYGDTLEVTLTNYNVLTIHIGNLLLSESEYIFNDETGELIIENVTGNVKIESLLYKKIYYIETTGVSNQYIDTLYVPNDNTTVVYDGMTISGDTALFGVRKSSSGTNKFSLQYISSNVYRASYKSKDYLLPKTYVSNDRYLFKMSPKDVYINGSLAVQIQSQTYKISPIGNLYLMALNTNNSQTHAGINRLYSFRIYEGETLIKSFIPVLDSDNVPCLYELVNNQFYYSPGTIPFKYEEIATHTITNNLENIVFTNTSSIAHNGDSYSTVLVPIGGRSLPEALIITSNGIKLIDGTDYTYNSETGHLLIGTVLLNIDINEPKEQVLTSLTSTGKEYIDTGYIPTVNTKVEFANIPAVTNYGNWQAFFGTKASNSNNDSFYISSCSSAISAWVGGIQVSDGNYNFIHTIGSTQVITLSKDGVTICEDGVTKVSRTKTGTFTFTNPGSIYLFGRNAGGVANYFGAFKLLYFKIYENDELVMSLIPKVDIHGEYYMYDIISTQSFYNEGTGSFIGE